MLSASLNKNISNVLCVTSFCVSTKTPPGQRMVSQLFRHIQLWGDDYFRNDGDPHEVGIIVIF